MKSGLGSWLDGIVHMAEPGRRQLATVSEWGRSFPGMAASAEEMAVEAAWPSAK